jgi:hypothetical protein
VLPRRFHKAEIRMIKRIPLHRLLREQEVAGSSPAPPIFWTDNSWDDKNVVNAYIVGESG